MPLSSFRLSSIAPKGVLSQLPKSRTTTAKPQSNDKGCIGFEFDSIAILNNIGVVYIKNGEPTDAAHHLNLALT
eukprot:12243849-Ditylum_brightwellii.AAC.1